MTGHALLSANRIRRHTERQSFLMADLLQNERITKAARSNMAGPSHGICVQLSLIASLPERARSIADTVFMAPLF